MKHVVRNTKIQRFPSEIGSPLPDGGCKIPKLTKILAVVLCSFPFFYMLVLGGCIGRNLTKPTTQMDAAPEYWIRVLLFENINTCKLKVNSSFQLIDSQTQTPLATFNKLDEPAILTLSNGAFFIQGYTFKVNELIIAPNDPHIFNLNSCDFRGKLKLIFNADGTFDAVNLIPLEPYLAGVVGAEMPDYWESAALQAQTIAARTYCLYIKNRFGSTRNWDVKKTQANQTYQGVIAESNQVWRTVNQTQGKVLTCHLLDGHEGIFPAYYSAVCGGHTENSGNVFGGDTLQPLLGVPCPYCKYTAKPSFYFWPIAQYDKAIVTAKLIEKYPKLSQLGKITQITPTGQSVYAEQNVTRLTSITLTGSTGKTDSIRAEDLRLTIDPTGRQIKSPACEIVDLGDKWAFISGKGFGHGVGMCQYGAAEMAREGKTATEILSYYYPGSKIASIY
jgi:stage II sporulation protein D